MIPGLTEAQRRVTEGIVRAECDAGAVWVFGSRATGTQRPSSDLDLLFDPPLPLASRARMSFAFEESNLPFKVDLVNLADLAPDYRARVLEARQPLFAG